MIPAQNNPHIGELRILPDAGAEVHLFTDHATVHLREIEGMLREAMRGHLPPTALAP